MESEEEKRRKKKKLRMGRVGEEEEEEKRRKKYRWRVRRLEVFKVFLIDLTPKRPEEWARSQWVINR